MDKEMREQSDSILNSVIVVHKRMLNKARREIAKVLDNKSVRFQQCKVNWKRRECLSETPTNLSCQRLSEALLLVGEKA